MLAGHQSVMSCVVKTAPAAAAAAAASASRDALSRIIGLMYGCSANWHQPLAPCCASRQLGRCAQRVPNDNNY